MKRWLIVIAVLSAAYLPAQNLTLTGVANLRLRNSGAITDADQVTGYYFFYQLEKKDKKTVNYLLSVYDENLRKINEVTIARPSSYILIEGVFNGEAFGFLFFDRRSIAIELISFDRKLTQLGSATKKLNNTYALSTYNALVAGTEPSQAYLVPLPGKGFLYYGYKETNSYHFEISFYNNKMQREWFRMAPANADVELASQVFQDSLYIGSLIMKKKRMNAKNFEHELMVQSAKTGSILFRKPLADEERTISLSEVYYDSLKQNIVVFGEYYNKDDRELKDQSRGFITSVLDLEGNVLLTKTNSWQEISKVSPFDEQGKFEGLNANVIFHNTILGEDGQIFVVGEQYKKAVSGAGVALQILTIAAMVAAGGGGYYGNSAGSMQLNIYNMVVLEFNPDYSIHKVHLFEKDKNVVMLPGGAGFMSPKELSFYVKAIGGFDYIFTQESKENGTFVVAYINYDKQKGGSAKNVLGTIVYTPEKTFTTDKMELSRKSVEYAISKAKDGYVLVTEYFRKEKKIESRLEKINY